MNASLSRVLVGIFAAGAIAAALPAGADSGRKMHGSELMPSFGELDANGDGSVSVEEVEAFLDAKFAEQDADGDGMLSAEELKNAMMALMASRIAKHSERMLDRLDDDGDGMIGRNEIAPASMLERMFERLDSDDDGMISEEEFEMMKNKHGRGWNRDRHGKRGDSWHGGKGHGKNKGSDSQ